MPEIEMSRKSSEALPSINDFKSLNRFKSQSFNYAPKVRSPLIRTRTMTFKEDDPRCPPSPQVAPSEWSNNASRISRSRFQSAVSD